jgi:hypothetical protein
MNNEQLAELFVLKSAVISADLSRVTSERGIKVERSEIEQATDALIAPYMEQIDYSIRSSAERMAEFYQIFYMLENHIRSFVSDMLLDSAGAGWWNSCVPEPIRKYAHENKAKENKEGLPPRSKNLIDYLTFGHLGEVIKSNWSVFAGIFPNCEIERLERVVARLNIARGPIAHCGYLPEEEVVRLKLAISDWFALQE